MKPREWVVVYGAAVFECPKGVQTVAQFVE
jgi:hypothetical protein